MQFGGKKSRIDKAKMVEDRYGKTTKGTAEKVKPETKVKPILKKGKIGVKVTTKF